MAKLVVNGALLQCTMGTTPSSLTALPDKTTDAGMVPAANIMDYQPNVNIMSFGMCQSPSNPQVAAATAAAMGVLTPQPCVPVVVAPWAPGCATFQIGMQPALNDSSTCMCTWAGTISVTSAGQTSIDVP